MFILIVELLVVGHSREGANTVDFVCLTCFNLQARHEICGKLQSYKIISCLGSLYEQLNRPNTRLPFW